MKSKVTAISLSVMMFTILSSHAEGDKMNQPVSAADQLYSLSLSMTRSSSQPRQIDTQSCATDETAVITIYSTNGQAQSEIDVKLNGSTIGSLTTYFPTGEPGCKTPSADGVITLQVPAGKHTLEAVSPNVNWPSHDFSVKKCQCMVLPLS